MMSIAKILSMAMAELLIVMLKVRGRYGRTYNYAVGRRTSTIVFLGRVVLHRHCWGVNVKRNSHHVGRDDGGRYVDDVEGHRVEVGVGVLPN